MNSKHLVRIILGVILLLAVGAIAGVAGYLTKNKPAKISQPQVSSMPEPASVKSEFSTADPKKIDMLKYIPEKSFLLEKVIDDIDGDGVKEIVLSYLTNFRDFVYPAKMGNLNFTILKIDESGQYKTIWTYNYGDMSYEEGKVNEWISVYDKNTDSPKIAFYIYYTATSGLHAVSYYDKKQKEFGVARFFNEDIATLPKTNTVKGPLDFKSVGENGFQKIAEILHGYIFEWNNDKHIYEAINTCLANNTTSKPGDTTRKVYRDTRYNYEIEFNANADIECKPDTVRVGFSISPPIKNVAENKIKIYGCVEGEGEKNIIGSTPSGTHLTNCYKIPSKNGFDIYRHEIYYPHDASDGINYNLLKKEANGTYTIVQISRGFGQGSLGPSPILDNMIASFRFIQ